MPRNTMAQVALRRPDDRTKAVRDTISEILDVDDPRKRFAAMMSGLDIHHDLGGGHPLLGRRMPDPDPVAANGPPRVFTLLHDVRPVLPSSWADAGKNLHAQILRLQRTGVESRGWARS